MMKQIKQEKVNICRQLGNHALLCTFTGVTMEIQVANKTTDEIYWTMISADTIPQPIRLLFPDPQSIFQFFKQPTDTGEIMIPSSDSVIIKFKVGRRLVEYNFALSKKVITIEQKLLMQVKRLQNQIILLKQKSQDSKQQIKLHSDINKKQQKIISLQKQITIITQLNKTLEQNIKLSQSKNSQITAENLNLLNQKFNLEAAVQRLTGLVQSQNLIINNLQNQLKEKSEIIQGLSGNNQQKPYKKQQIKNNENIKRLIFKPLTSSINYNCYTYQNKLLIKNKNSNTGAGRLIPDQNIIPKKGKYSYKFINRNIKDNPNFRMGVISRTDLSKQNYMNGGDADAVMYYCYSSNQQIIYEGTSKLQGFNINRGDSITVIIDRQNQQIQWRVNQQFKTISRFTESMKKSQNLIFFVQLWTNGDGLQIVE